MAPITAPISGMSWIAEKILEQAAPELNEKENLSKQLLALQLAFDMGDMSEEDFEEQEEALLLEIQQLEDRDRLEAEALKAEALEAEALEAEAVIPELEEGDRLDAEVPLAEIGDHNRIPVNNRIERKDKRETKVPLTR